MAGGPVSIEVRWMDGEKEVRRPANELISVMGTGKTMEDPDWIYNGSVTANGIFYAQLQGDLVSLIPDEAALINSRAFKRTGAHVFEVHSEAVPPPKTRVEVVFKLLP